MELYDAHVAAKTALDSAACSKKGKKHNKKDEAAPKRPVSQVIGICYKKSGTCRTFFVKISFIPSFLYMYICPVFFHFIV